ncbi:MAG: 50S ribosomal protein L22 [Deltaproteobacteria bacterium]|nr:50S ribosomal protein L22 [Deltaproteobacteria bacterium]
MGKNSINKRDTLAKASNEKARVAPRKARLVIDQIRGEKVVIAMAFLENTRYGSSPIVLDILKSAVANAVEKDKGVNPDDLIITEARVDQGQTLKRMRPRAMGRANVILKKSSRIFLAVG